MRALGREHVEVELLELGREPFAIALPEPFQASQDVILPVRCQALLE